MIIGHYQGWPFCLWLLTEKVTFTRGQREAAFEARARLNPNPVEPDNQLIHRLLSVLLHHFGQDQPGRIRIIRPSEAGLHLK
ncbi:MAG TPA: hypothetical protein VLT92_18575 [Burkholderiales bacterium]|nr:hypothetical protein [Burkholderiales bacterium]